MSEEAADELEQARLEFLLSQRVCSWCNIRFESSEDLADHIIREHK